MVRRLGELPGPQALPVAGDALRFRRDRLGFLTGCAREYGDAARFRIGPVGVVLLSHPDAVRDVLSGQQHDFAKSPVLQRARIVLGDGLLTSEGEAHRSARALIQPAFHPRRVAGQAAQMAEIARRRVHAWPPGRPIDVHAETVRTTLTVAGRTLFGTDLDEDVAVVSGALTDLLSAYGVLMLPAGPLLAQLPLTRQRLRRGAAALHRLTDRLLDERAAADQAGGPADPGDLLSLLRCAGPDGAGPNGAADRVGPPAREGARRDERQWARDQVVTLLLAGHETTANALAFACHLLARDQDVQREVAEEVLSVCGPDGVPGAADVERLPSVRAVLAETLRLFPPSWAMGRQALVSTELGGVELPRGTVVVVSQWVVHRDGRWWPEPHRFDPSRFASGSVPLPRFSYFPFGGGTRRCIGEGFAWTEGILTLATILAKWRLRPIPGRRPRLDPLVTLRPRGGVWLVPEPARNP